MVLLSDHSKDGKDGFDRVSMDPSVLRVNAPIRDFMSGRVAYQSNIIGQHFKNGDAIVVFANPRFVSFWLLMLVARLRGAKVFAHGQGNYAHPSGSLFRKFMYRVICGLSYRYICYNEFVRVCMLRIGCNADKLVVADNSVQIDAPVHPEGKDYCVSGVLFVGRLREGCSLGVAVEAVSRLRAAFSEVCLYVVGSGPMESRYRKEFDGLDWVRFHGSIYDHELISRISRKCRVGCYPGNAGLSVVHMFALSLPVVVHSKVHQHMGPESAYVVDKFNGFLFDPDEDPVAALFGSLRLAWSMTSDELREIGRNSFRTYEELTQPSLGERFLGILEGGADKS